MTDWWNETEEERNYYIALAKIPIESLQFMLIATFILFVFVWVLTS